MVAGVRRGDGDAGREGGPMTSGARRKTEHDPRQVVARCVGEEAGSTAGVRPGPASTDTLAVELAVAVDRVMSAMEEGRDPTAAEAEADRVYRALCEAARKERG